MQDGMLRCLTLICLVCGVLLAASGVSVADEIRMTNGDVYRGEPVSFDDEGVVLRLDIGGYSPRLSWARMTQQTLKELQQREQARQFAEPFIELTPEEIEQERKKKEIVLRPVPRMERAEHPRFFAALTTPIGMFVFGVLYLANLFAAYEIAVYRRRPAALVVGVSAILPILGPIIFLSVPTAEEYAESDVGTEELQPAHAGSAGGAGRITGSLPAAAGGGGGGLAIAQDKTQSSTPVAEPSVYKRGDFTFNRRFFESKFPGFFRVVPSEAEKDLVFVVRTPKNEYVARRITRIASNDMHLQLLRGGSEASVGFGEIIEVQVRHKDAKA